MNSSKKSNAFFNAPSMTSTVKHGPSQTFLNLGFNDNSKSAAAYKNEPRATRYSRPFEEPTTVTITRPNGHNYSQNVAKYLGTGVAGASK